MFTAAPHASVLNFKKLCGTGGSVVHLLCANLLAYQSFFSPYDTFLSHCFSCKFGH